MAKILVEIPLTKYLKLSGEFFGELDGVYVTKLKGGCTYISDGKPWVSDDKEEVDFDMGYTHIPKDFSKHIDLKSGESKPIKQVIKEIKNKEKQ